jgi:predicted kinase
MTQAKTTMEEQEPLLVQLRFCATLTLADQVKRTVDEQSAGHVVILRGMPGSGKTTFANELAYCVARHALRSEVCSADEFFYEQKGCYVYDQGKLDEAHHKCRARFREAMARGVDCIIIDNSNLSPWEFRIYWDDAHLNGYACQFVEFVCENEVAAYELLRRTTHDIPADVLRNKMEGYQKSPTVGAIIVPTTESIRFP